jgi:O-acetyl-ADP-ribose deacetylase (regulator of RNase III)
MPRALEPTLGIINDHQNHSSQYPGNARILIAYYSIHLPQHFVMEGDMLNSGLNGGHTPLQALVPSQTNTLSTPASFQPPSIPAPAAKTTGPADVKNRKSCFVIMPFGSDRIHPVTKARIDFDAVYRDLIEPAAVEAGVSCIRSDKVSESGLIHHDMINRLMRADIAIVDITTGNPNVLYELGVRHTARRSGTIVMHQNGDAIPFNINGIRILNYHAAPSAHDLGEDRAALFTTLKNALAGMHTDSLVHTLIPGLNMTRPSQPLKTKKQYVWRCPRAPLKKICAITGDILNVCEADIWVNPENTKMQMCRVHDDTVSASIRYYGAVRNQRGVVIKDTIMDALERQIGRGRMVEPGTAIATTAGCLKRTNNVKCILHVAAQYGEPGKGYLTIRGYDSCIASALDEVDIMNQSMLTRLGFRTPLTSIIFPLLGTRGTERDPQTVADNLIRSARDFLETTPDTKIETVYFLAYTDTDNELCEAAFRHADLVFKEEDQPK